MLNRESACSETHRGYCAGKPSNAHQATLAPLDLRQVSQGIAQDGIRLWRHTWDTLGMLMPRS